MISLSVSLEISLKITALLTLICSSFEDRMKINELALSCRAMGRKVEHALLEEIVGLCKDRELGVIRINVQKTHRNHQIINSRGEGFPVPSLKVIYMRMI